jgi:hypothetical protein
VWGPTVCAGRCRRLVADRFLELHGGVPAWGSSSAPPREALSPDLRVRLVLSPLPLACFVGLRLLARPQRPRVRLSPPTSACGSSSAPLPRPKKKKRPPLREAPERTENAGRAGGIVGQGAVWAILLISIL